MEREIEWATDRVREAARKAATLQGTVPVREKGGGAGPVSEADIAVERFLLDGLAEAFPDDPVLSEETSTGIDRSGERFWCVDPIDGTREYVAGRTEWAVQLGLVVDGEPVFGVLGMADRVVWGARGRGAFVLRGAGPAAPVAAVPVEDPARAVAAHSRSHLDEATLALLDRLGVTGRFASGSVGYKVAAMLDGRAHLFAYPGSRCQLWDSAAPAAVWLAAGGTATDAEGAPLSYRGPLQHERGLVFAAPGLLEPVLAALREIRK